MRIARRRTVLRCAEACPRELPVTSPIGEVKQGILEGSARAEPVRQPKPNAA